MPRTTIRQDRERLLEENQALRTRVRQLEEALANSTRSSADTPINSSAPAPHPQGYPLGDPDFPYQRMVEELSEGLVALSATHAIRYVNRRFAALLGRRAPGLLDVDFFELVAPEDLSRFEAFLGEPANPYIELQLIGADGRRRPVEISTRDWIVNGIRTFLVVIDLTDRQRMQATIAQNEVERRKIEKSLQDSERYFERIFQLSPTAIVLSHLDDSRILDVNDKFLRLTGFSREQVIGESAIALGLWVNEAERARLRVRLEDGKPVHHYEAHLRTQRGEVRDVLISADLIGRQAENVILALFDDITDRKRADDAVRRYAEHVRQYASQMQRYAAEVQQHAEERREHATLLERMVRERTAELDAERARWRGVVEGIADEVWVCDAQGKMSLINLPDVTHMGLAEFTDKSVAQVYEEVDILNLDGEMRPQEQAPLLRALKGEIVRGEEIMRHRQTGKTRYRQFSAAPTRDASGAITGAVAIVRDITDLKQAQEEIKTLARFPAENPNPVLRLDQKGVLLYANESSTPLLTAWGITLGGVAPEFLRVVMAQAFESQQGRVIEAEIQERSYSFNIAPVQRGGYINLYGRDITERKRAERQVQQLNQALEHRATELEIANKELESFSYSVSHDLRAPLSSIGVFARTLQEDLQLPEKAQRYLRMIQSNTEQMEELITSLLALSRLTGQPIRKERVNMTTLVREALETLQKQVQRPDLTVEVKDLPDAQADPVLLKQVWVNLIANALKFTRKCGNARVEIGCGPEDGEPRVYYVRDNGVGFDMQQADRLFGVFQRLHSEEDYEGTGIGLAIVQRIITRHGGRVWAEAQVNRGATFYFTLGREHVA